jgi:hypothetical protein
LRCLVQRRGAFAGLFFRAREEERFQHGCAFDIAGSTWLWPLRPSTGASPGNHLVRRHEQGLCEAFRFQKLVTPASVPSLLVRAILMSDPQRSSSGYLKIPPVKSKIMKAIAGFHVENQRLRSPFQAHAKLSSKRGYDHPVNREVLPTIRTT